MRHPDARVVLLERRPKSRVKSQGTSLSTFLLLLLGALLCFGIVTYEVSSEWMGKQGTQGRGQDHFLARVVSEEHLTGSPGRKTQGRTTRTYSLTGYKTQPLNTPPCSPNTTSIETLISEGLSKSLYDQLQRAHNLTGIAAPPIFTGRHHYLCTAFGSPVVSKWDSCLPISGRKDEPFCVASDRRDLLVSQSPSTLCFASVLHLLLHYVYATLKAFEAQPALLYGTLLGAVRNGAIIPFTEDVDIGYQFDSRDPRLGVVKDALARRGYHMFMDNIWRVCVAPTHPLAKSLFDPRVRIPVRGCTGPYVNLYAMQQRSGLWHVQEARQWHNSDLTDAKMVPYSQVSVNGELFDTVADPIDFFNGRIRPRIYDTETTAIIVE